jgi:protein tyrosine phosphatase (PTP) superfamily phosphohydrolase (DUF442 family)
MRIVKTVAKVLGVLLIVVVLALAVPVWMYFPGHNFRTVEAGAFYGSRQMGSSALESAIKKYGIQTVVNLRGTNPGSPWYDNEVAVCQKLGVAHEDFGWSRSRLPKPESLLRFVEMVETGKKPFLAHCEGGTHRTGAAAACYVLLTGGDAAAARKQFGPFFNDAPIGQLVDLYEGSALSFGQWVREVYPGRYAQVVKAARPADGTHGTDRTYAELAVAQGAK